MVKKTIKSFHGQRQNANAHSPRGMGLLGESMDDVGWFTAMTATADGEVIDGSARIEKAQAAFADADPIIVESDGTRPIVHIRTDIPDAQHPKAKKLAVYANRVAEVNLTYDSAVLLQIDEEIGLSDMFLEIELEEHRTAIALIEPEESDTESSERRVQKKASSVKAVLPAEDVATFEQAIRAVGEQNRGKAIIEICQFYLANHAER